MTLNASVEVLNNNRDSMTERNQIFDLLTDDVTRFTALVEDLLEISRYDVGTASLRAEPIDLVEFVRQSVDHSPYDVVIDVEALQHLVVAGDKRRLAQVVANLVDNAESTAPVRSRGCRARRRLRDHRRGRAGVPKAERA